MRVFPYFTAVIGTEGDKLEIACWRLALKKRSAKFVTATHSDRDLLLHLGDKCWISYPVTFMCTEYAAYFAGGVSNLQDDVGVTSEDRTIARLLPQGWSFGSTIRAAKTDVVVTMHCRRHFMAIPASGERELEVQSGFPSKYLRRITMFKDENAVHNTAKHHRSFWLRGINLISLSCAQGKISQCPSVCRRYPALIFGIYISRRIRPR